MLPNLSNFFSKNNITILKNKTQTTQISQTSIAL